VAQALESLALLEGGGEGVWGTDGSLKAQGVSAVSTVVGAVDAALVAGRLDLAISLNGSLAVAMNGSKRTTKPADPNGHKLKEDKVV
jgi:hypothetical protein